jgi:predicted XRE-type DNA-binding protein
MTYQQRFKTVAERFSEKHEVDEDGCWVWKGKDTDYPKFWDGEKHVRASRFSLAGKIGRDLLIGEQACHTCDNVRCVNPDHLFVGSHSENMKDKAEKGRVSDIRGERNPNAKLKAYDVQEILSMKFSGKSQEAIASAMGVSQTQVSRILRGESWGK